MFIYVNGAPARHPLKISRLAIGCWSNRHVTPHCGSYHDDMDMTRINLANPQELLELPGIHQAAGDAIVRHRGQQLYRERGWLP